MPRGLSAVEELKKIINKQANFYRKEIRNGFLFFYNHIGSEAGKFNFIPLASHENLWRHNKSLRRCDTRRHSRSDNHKRERRRVF
jgi:hypothetical protein